MKRLKILEWRGLKWQGKLKLRRLRENLSSRLGRETGVPYVVEQEGILESLEFAEFVLGSWLTRACFLVLRRQAGNSKKLRRRGLG